MNARYACTYGYLQQLVYSLLGVKICSACPNQVIIFISIRRSLHTGGSSKGTSRKVGKRKRKSKGTFSRLSRVVGPISITFSFLCGLSKFPCQ